MSVIGAKCFGHKYRFGTDQFNKKFPYQTLIMSDFRHSWVLIFKALCGSWFGSLNDCLDSSGPACIPFFIAVIYIGKYVFLNISTVLLLSSTNSIDQKCLNKPIDSSELALSGAVDRFLAVINRIIALIRRRDIYEKPVNDNITQYKETIMLHNQTEEASDEPGACCPNCINKLTPSCCSGKWWKASRTICLIVSENFIFDIVTILLALLYAGSLAATDINYKTDAKSQQHLCKIQRYIPFIFFIEMIIRLIGRGFINQFSNGWRIIDLAIVTILLICSIMMPCIKRNVFYVQPFRILGALRIFRIVKLGMYINATRVIANTILEAIPGLVNVIIMGVCQWLIFAVIGVQLFAGKLSYCIDDFDTIRVIDVDRHSCLEQNLTWVVPYMHFEYFSGSLFTLTQISTFKGWENVIKSATSAKLVDEVGKTDSYFDGYFYFVFFFIFGSYFMYVLWFSVIIDGFNRQRKNTEMKSKWNSSGDIFYSKARRYISTAQLQSKKRELQSCILHMTESIPFDIIIIILIFGNFAVFGAHHFNETKKLRDIILALEGMFIGLYLLEISFRILAERADFICNIVNWIDAAAILLAIHSLSARNLESIISIPPLIIRIFRILYILSTKRWKKWIPRFNCALSALCKTVPYFLSILLLLAMLIFVYGILGVLLFQDNSNIVVWVGLDQNINFDYFGKSILMLWHFTLNAKWVDVLGIQLLDKNPCGLQMCRFIYLISFEVIAFLILFTILTVAILELYSEARAEQKLGMTIEDCASDFYKIWSEFDPLATGYIPLTSLNNLVGMLSDPLLIFKPSLLKIAVLDITIVFGERVNHKDVIDALYRRALYRKGHPVSDVTLFKDLHKPNIEYIPVSTTLWRKREEYSTHVIRKTWRSFKQQHS